MLKCQCRDQQRLGLQSWGAMSVRAALEQGAAWEKAAASPDF